ncbi:ABC transporter ATP-binding protein [Bacilliculturomica massiliensis]|uniref:ABC transporter ATP-binding protein n=1 Tax=Bacilliculturomica massiliensis TaxID=1917867 RepID=UPI00103155B2|nr:ABC transporter ATP-binding protein [Bacilliculturomica massiliensis]
MITVTGLTKNFDGFRALNDLDLHVDKGSIYGLIGVNGSGKTTLIKHLTGILRPDFGQVLMDGCPVYENRQLKQRTGYIPDDLYFFSSTNLNEAARFYRSLYPNWNEKRYVEMTENFHLNKKIRMSRFSKGMQKQAAFLLTICAMPDYLILDEPIDGLDPIVRRQVWNYIVEDVAEREMTVLVSSHNLREMEGICDSVGILSHGSMLIERDLDELKTDIHKIQVAYRSAPENPYEGLNVLRRELRGSVELLVVRSSREAAEEIIRRHQPILFDILPLSLEEIFICELGGETSELQNILF